MAKTKKKGNAQARRRAKVAEVEDAPELQAADSEAQPARAKPGSKPRAARAGSRTQSKPKRRSAKQSAPVGDEPHAAAPAPKPRRARGAPIDLAQAIVQAAATNERMNQYLLEHLDVRAWSVKPVEGRTIAAIVSHMHNVRHMWLVVSARDFPAPAKLDRRTVTLEEARVALAESGLALRGLLERALEAGGKVKDFRPDAVAFLAYVVAHEAHHRGQICLLSRQIGLPLPKEAGYGMWDWNRRWRETQPTEEG